MITDGLEFMSKIEWLFWNQINVKVKIEIKIKAQGIRSCLRINERPR